MRSRFGSSSGLYSGSGVALVDDLRDGIGFDVGVAGSEIVSSFVAGAGEAG